MRLWVGLFGIAAGAVAVIVYFWNLWHSGRGSEAVDVDGEAAYPTSLGGQQPAAATGAIAPLVGSGEPSVAEDVRYQTFTAFLLSLEVMSAKLQHPQYTSSIDAAVQLVERLFIRRGREYELVIDPDGRFIIRPYEVLSREEKQEAAARILPFALIPGGKVEVN